MNYIKDLALKNADGSYNVIIEIPKGTNSKFELTDKVFDTLKEVRKVVGRYPFYYGCFPNTHSGDNDPLDMILLSNKKRNCLDVVPVEVIGVIKTIDNGEIDDKILVIAKDEVIKHLDKLEKKALKFLSKYKGKKSNTIIDFTIYDCEEGVRLIKEANALYNNIKKGAKSLSSF